MQITEIYKFTDFMNDFVMGSVKENHGPIEWVLNHSSVHAQKVNIKYLLESTESILKGLCVRFERKV